MNKKRILVLGLAVFFLFGTGGMLWADLANDCEPWNRPMPVEGVPYITHGMDYVPQELGIMDSMYVEYNEAGCRSCHGATLGDRHHFSPSGANCVLCHVLDPNEPSGVRIEHNCLAPGCHQWPYDIPGNGWHHNTDMAASENCIACHDPNLIEEITDFWDHQTYPPQVVTPNPFDCENCHWSQQISADHNSVDGDVDASVPGHPSTYDHYDRWDNLTGAGPTTEVTNTAWGFFEYDKPLFTNAKTHHMEGAGFVANACHKCHSQDPQTQDIDPFDPEYIRYCMICHSIPTLHRIGPHVQKHPGWNPVGFHLPKGGSGVAYENCADVDPTEYRTGDINAVGAGPFDSTVMGIMDNFWPDMDTSDNIFMYDATWPGIRQQPGYYWGQVPEPEKWYNVKPDTSNPSPTTAEDYASGSLQVPGVAEMPDYYTAIDQCAGCHGPDADEVPGWVPEVPPCEPDVNFLEPIAGSCTIHATIYGYCLGAEHTPDNGVMFVAVDIDPITPGDQFGNPLPRSAGGDGIVMPIHAWTNQFLEFEVPCNDPDLPAGRYFVMVFWYDETGLNFANGNTFVGKPVFSVQDHPTVVSVTHTTGGCLEQITISGGGGFGTSQGQFFLGGYYGKYTVVDFVNESGTYSVHSDAYVDGSWTDTSFDVIFGQFYEDLEDTCAPSPIYYQTDIRNFVQDDGTPVPPANTFCSGHVCEPEPTILGCSTLPLGCYNVYVKNVYFGDDDASGSLTCGDTLFQIEKSDPAEFCLVSEPYVNKIVPRYIECSFKCDEGYSPNYSAACAGVEGIFWQQLHIYGGDFGTQQGTSEVIIGPYGWYTSDPLSPTYYAQPFVWWSATLIKVGLVFPAGYQSYLTGKPYPGTLAAVWVRNIGAGHYTEVGYNPATDRYQGFVYITDCDMLRDPTP